MSGGLSVSHTRKDKRVLEDIGALAAQQHSRYRVYPQDITQTIRLTAAAVANTFGAWTLCIPQNTVTMEYHVVGVLVENMQAADSFFLQFGNNAAPSGADIIGECRLALGGLAGFFSSAPVPLKSQGQPINSPVYGRVKALSVNGYWIDISLTLTRHNPVTKEIATWPSWPW